MKKHLTIISILSVSILAACTSTKHLTLDNTKITSENSSTETVISNSQVISSTRVVESQDTSLVLQGHELFGSGKVKNLLSGDTIFSTVASLSLKTWYDSLSKTIRTQATAKPHEASFKYNKITESQVLQTGTTTSTKQEQQKQTVQSVKELKSVTRTSLPAWFVILIIIIIVSLVYFLFVKFKNIFKP